MYYYYEEKNMYRINPKYYGGIFIRLQNKV